VRKPELLVMKKDYFEILNLKPPANEEEIKQAYRNLAKKFHPDVNPDPDAHLRFLEISEAYEYLLEELKHSNRRVIYDQDEVFTHEYIEEMRRRAKERAQEKVRMRLEKLKKEHEAFQESGLYDFVLILKYLGRYILLLLCIALMAGSVVLSFGHTDTPIAQRLIMLFLGTTGLYFILQSGKSYFKAGNFFYTYQNIKKVFAYKNSEAQENCFFSPHFKANSRPFKINMIKIKDIKLQNYGPGQHSVAFNQKSVTLEIPRSHHALVVHSALIVIKNAILVYCIFFLDISSLFWRVIIAMFGTLIISQIIQFLTRTKSTASYLITPGLVIRASIWLFFILQVSYIQLRPFNVYTSDNIYSVAVFMIFFDSFLDQILNYLSGKRFRHPIFRQHPLIESHLEKNYQFGYDMPVLSVFYPVFKWFLG
jgi:curved DNA-binding protein CbpA